MSKSLHTEMHHVRDLFAATPFAGILKAADGSDAKCRFVNGLESASWRAPPNGCPVRVIGACSATAPESVARLSGAVRDTARWGGAAQPSGRMLEHSQMRQGKRGPNLEAERTPRSNKPIIFDKVLDRPRKLKTPRDGNWRNTAGRVRRLSMRTRNARVRPSCPLLFRPA